MIDPLDFEITISKDKRAIIRWSDGGEETDTDLLDLVRSAGDYLTAEQMNHLYEKLDEATCLARRLWRSM